MSQGLVQRVGQALSAPVGEAVRAFAARLGMKAGAIGVLFYGSNLRTGELEGVLDFYVLLGGPREGGIWPRVSYHEWRCGNQDLRAKVATMTLETFAAAAAGETLDTTIWARFVQPSALAWVAQDQDRGTIADAVAAAAITAARLAVALGPQQGTANDFWRALFRATYAAEFRVEKAGREDSILSFNEAHFGGLLPVALAAGGVAFTQTDDTVQPAMPAAERQRIIRWWALRRRLGKPYNIMRLLKASFTFEGAGRYAAWKIERHTGIPVALTPWQERHPVLAAPLVLWRIARAKARAK